MGRSGTLLVLAVAHLVVVHGGAQELKPAPAKPNLSVSVPNFAPVTKKVIILGAAVPTANPATSEAPAISQTSVPAIVSVRVSVTTLAPPSIENPGTLDAAVDTTQPPPEEKEEGPAIGRVIKPKRKRKRRRKLARGEKEPPGGIGSSSNEEGINDFEPVSARTAAANAVSVSNSNSGESSGEPAILARSNHAAIIRKRNWHKYLARNVVPTPTTVAVSEQNIGSRDADWRQSSVLWNNQRHHVQNRQQLLERRRRLQQKREKQIQLRERRRNFRRHGSKWPPSPFGYRHGRNDYGRFIRPESRWRPVTHRRPWSGNKFDNRFTNENPPPWNRRDRDRPEFYEQAALTGDDDGENWSLLRVGEGETYGRLAGWKPGRKPKKGRKHIKTLRRGEWVSVSVEDNGASSELYGPPATAR